MEYLDKIFNVDCFDVMKDMVRDGFKSDVILTSPPYNTGRRCSGEKMRKQYMARYDFYMDGMPSDEYIGWCGKLFEMFDRVLAVNGVVIWNVSYGNDCTENLFGFNLVWLVIADLIRQSPFCVADRVIWKKTSALPNNVSPNKLTRIVEDVFIFCRKGEVKTFNCNKKINGKMPSGQPTYSNFYNFIEAKNNDGSNPFNKATFSSDLVIKLLNIYAKKNAVVYDPFMGTGMTAVACKRVGLHYVGSELSKQQCEYAEKRLLFDNDISRLCDFKGGLF